MGGGVYGGDSGVSRNVTCLDIGTLIAYFSAFCFFFFLFFSESASTRARFTQMALLISASNENLMTIPPSKRTLHVAESIVGTSSQKKNNYKLVTF